MQIYIYHQRNQHDNTIVRKSRLIEIIVRNKQLTKNPRITWIHFDRAQCLQSKRLMWCEQLMIRTSIYAIDSMDVHSVWK